MTDKSTSESIGIKSISQFVQDSGHNVDIKPDQLDPDEDKIPGDPPVQVPLPERPMQKDIAGLYRILSRKNFHKKSVIKYLQDKGYATPTTDELKELKAIRKKVKDTFCDEKY